VKRIPVEEVARPRDEAWDAAVEESGLPFRFSHRAAAGRAFEAAYPSYTHDSRVIRFADGTKLLVPLVRVSRQFKSLRMQVGMPLGLEGTPIALAGMPAAEHINGLLVALDGVGLLALHGGAGGSPPATGEVARGETHVLDLRPGFDELWSNSFSAKNRNSCRKAERAGVAVGEESTAAGTTEYWALYEAATRAWGYDVPPYPDGLFAALIETGHAELWLARLDGQAIAGALLLRGSEDLLYWSGAMDRAFQGVAPSNAVIRQVIESACSRAISYLDFGASGRLTGVEKFKTSFGAEPRSFVNVTLRSRLYRVASLLQGRRSG
jgi:hypothetical protein